ncbi:hypothetical protein P9443_07895 [Peribacillus frigoritolerans]|uniref:hypothetical protein n=1 Tax=Peribacillus frigoritolerans TaxID=450367 RepID=UPI002E1A6662|nr:hypothetical protein [Peribacillus frigoritolerans]
MSKVPNTWQSMTKEEAEKYWKEGIGFEMAHYDSNMEMDKEIDTKEKLLKKLIISGKHTKDEIKDLIDLPASAFEIIYARNKK